MRSYRTSGNGLALCQGQGLDWILGEKFFPKSMAKPWTKLPRAVVQSPSLEGFQRRTGVVLRDTAQG